MIPVLDVSPDLSGGLPLDAVTETIGILAVKRAGKSNAAVVLAEEMHWAGLWWVAIDPKGDWWGVRSSADGKHEGLSVVVFGGEHGDVPLEPGAGRLVANLIVEHRISCVLDVSAFTRADLGRFVGDFTDALYRSHTPDHEPIHVFMEEADEYVPQRVTGEWATCVARCERLVKRGGFRGIGVTMVTQRSASLNKDVLTQIGTLIAMRTTGPQDRRAIRDWVEYHAAGAEIVNELPTLKAGEAWVFSPAWLDTVTKVRFRQRRTFDSGATPKVGQARKAPTRLADVDLDAIKEQMRVTIERARSEDPKILRARIGDLERELAKRPVETVTETVTIEVIPPAVTAAATGLADLAKGFMDQYAVQAEALLEAVRDTEALPRGVRLVDPPAAPAPVTRSQAARRVDERTGLGTSRQRVLDALGWLTVTLRRDVHDRRQVAFIANYSPGSGNFNNLLGALRSDGLVEYPVKGQIALTPEGRALAAMPEHPGTEAELREAIYAKLGKSKAKVLRAVLDAGDDVLVARTTIADDTGYSAGSGNFNNLLGNLRSLGLIDYPQPGWVQATEVMYLR